MDLFWIAVLIILFALTLGLVALCDPHPKGTE